MNCPKCQGGSYLVDEEAVKVIETSSPAVIILKQTFVCRSCGDRFTRIASDDASSRSGASPSPQEHHPAQPVQSQGVHVTSMTGSSGAYEGYVPHYQPQPEQHGTQKPKEKDAENEKIKFLDDI